MRLVIQRCTRASVTVGDTLVSSIGEGLMVLVGFQRADARLPAADMLRCAKRLVNGRYWDNEEGKAWQMSAKQSNREILIVSQFTLWATHKKGNKPDFHDAMGGADALVLFDSFCALVAEHHADPALVKKGAFGEMMKVDLVNDGPVTIVLQEDAPSDAPSDPSDAPSESLKQ